MASHAAIKAEGNAAFNAGNYDDALAKYAAALEALDAHVATEGAGHHDAAAVHARAALHSNRAACHLALKAPAEALAEPSAAVPGSFPGSSTMPQARSNARTSSSSHSLMLCRSKFASHQTAPLWSIVDPRTAIPLSMMHMWSDPQCVIVSRFSKTMVSKDWATFITK